MNSTRTVLLTGATAQVGLHLLPALRTAGLMVLALSRQAPAGKLPSPAASEAIHWVRPEQLRSWIQGRPREAGAILPTPDILVSAGPISLALEWLEYCRGIRRLVCLSTTSIFSKAESGSAAERQQVVGIVRAESQLGALCADRGIDLCLLRPTLIYGCGMDENISRMASFIQRFGFLPLAGRASGLRQPIHVADLAELILRACNSGPQGQHEFIVTGGSTLSYHDMAAKVFRALGKPVRLPSLPPAVLSIAVALISKLAGAAGLDPAMVTRQNVDLVFDDGEARRYFNFQPRAFEPVPEDFELPDEIAASLPGWLRQTLGHSGPD